ncbi:hypothetical protein EON62_03890, partial [archaeon]
MQAGNARTIPSRKTAVGRRLVLLEPCSFDALINVKSVPRADLHSLAHPFVAATDGTGSAGNVRLPGMVSKGLHAHNALAARALYDALIGVRWALQNSAAAQPKHAPRFSGMSDSAPVWLPSAQRPVTIVAAEQVSHIVVASITAQPLTLCLSASELMQVSSLFSAFTAIQDAVALASPRLPASAASSGDAGGGGEAFHPASSASSGSCGSASPA